MCTFGKQAFQWKLSSLGRLRSGRKWQANIPELGVICGLSLLVLNSAPRRFSPGTLVFPSPPWKPCSRRIINIIIIIINIWPDNEERKQLHDFFYQKILSVTLTLNNQCRV